MSKHSDVQDHGRRPAGSTEYVETVIIGDAWRKRWDSLRLFTPARYDGLEGLPFPAPALTFPTKDEMTNYLESYAARFDLPVQTGVRVDELSRRDGRYALTSGDRCFEAEHVVVAAGAHQIPKIPVFASELDSSILQLHSSQYRHPSQLQEGAVLVVGAGNSGAEIAFEVSRTHPTHLSGKPSGQLPFRHGPAMARFVFPVVRFVGHHVLTLRTPIGRNIQPKFISHSALLIRVKYIASREPKGRSRAHAPAADVHERLPAHPATM